MDSLDYLQPLELTNEDFKKNTLGQTVVFNSVIDGFPELEGVQAAIVGVYEDRGSKNNKGCAEAPNRVREFLYDLYISQNHVKIADLGDIFAGNELTDTYFAVTNVVAELISKGIVPVIIGGSQDLTFANYLAYEKLEQIINLVCIDKEFDIGEKDEELNSHSYLTKILLHQPNFLFNYSNIGYQTYFVNQDSLELMNKLYFDVNRLGDMRADMKEIEPIVRNADMMSFDISAIRFSDAPANENTSANGFYGEEACQIMRYAGMSDKLTSLGIYELNPKMEKGRKVTAELIGQMVWYFIEGMSNRKKDMPVFNKKDFKKYRVSLEDNKYELVFYKSKKTDRWWMDVPYPQHKGMKYERHHLVPCSYRDYEIACREEMPNKWWLAYQKLS